MGKEITVLSSGSARPALDLSAAEFQKATGHTVSITYNMDEKGSQRLEDGEIFDVVLGSTDSLNRNFRPAGLVEPGGSSIGRVGTGITIRAGAPVPDISCLEALKRATLEADAILLSSHSSGLYVEKVLKDLGIHAQVEGRMERFPNGPDLMDRVLAGSGREFAFLTINQILMNKGKGLVYVGPLPEEVQDWRDFLLVPTAKSPNKEAAWDFVRFCGGPGKRLFVDHGFV